MCAALLGSMPKLSAGLLLYRRRGDVVQVLVASTPVLVQATAVAAFGAAAYAGVALATGVDEVTSMVARLQARRRSA